MKKKKPEPIRVDTPVSKEDFGPIVKRIRLEHNLTQSQVAEALNVTPGYISNVENNRTAMSLRMLMYYARLTDTSLDSLAGVLVPEYQETALDQDLIAEIRKMDVAEKEKLLKTLKIWRKK